MSLILLILNYYKLFPNSYTACFKNNCRQGMLLDIILTLFMSPST